MSVVRWETITNTSTRVKVSLSNGDVLTMTVAEAKELAYTIIGICKKEIKK